MNIRFTTAGKIVFAVIFAALTAVATYAQGDNPSGTISSSGSGPSYTYDITFSDAASSTSPLGSVWYAWTPGFFYLPGTPTSASAPSGWTASIVANSIQFSANSPGNDIAAGSSLSGFSYNATFSPATLASAPNGGTSVGYSGGIESDAGVTFTVQAVPEPSSIGLLALGGTTLLALARRRKI